MREKIRQTLTDARAIRIYDEREIPNEDWQLLLQVAQNAPSSNGLEPWRILQIESLELREKLASLAPGMKNQLLSAPKFIFFVSVSADKAYCQHLQQEIHGYSDEAFRKWAVNFERLSEELLDIDLQAWKERQTALPAAQMLFAANLLGIDTWPMEGIFYKQAEKLLENLDALNPETEHLAIALSFGYRKTAPEFPKTRRPLGEIVKII